MAGGQQNSGFSTGGAGNGPLSAPEFSSAPNGDDWEDRLSRIEAESENLHNNVALLRAEWENTKLRQGDIRSAYEELREAVLRYAVACAATDVQVAMLRARGENSEAAENLRRCVEEQTQASDALRSLARIPRPTR